MTPNQLYALKPKEVTRDLWYLVPWDNHIEESTVTNFDICSKTFKENTRVEVRVIYYDNIDGERYIRMSTVWFDDKPVMIIQNAGRGGADHSARFITNKELFFAMCDYLRSLKDDSDPRFVVHDPDTECTQLTEFYGCELVNEEDE